MSNERMIVREWEWRDVVPIFPPEGLSIRFATRDYVGDQVLHCHLFQHEDKVVFCFKCVSIPYSYSVQQI